MLLLGLVLLLSLLLLRLLVMLLLKLRLLLLLDGTKTGQHRILGKTIRHYRGRRSEGVKGFQWRI
jgi:hypothetical protein